MPAVELAALLVTLPQFSQAGFPSGEPSQSSASVDSHTPGQGHKCSLWGDYTGSHCIFRKALRVQSSFYKQTKKQCKKSSKMMFLYPIPELEPCGKGNQWGNPQWSKKFIISSATPTQSEFPYSFVRGCFSKVTKASLKIKLKYHMYSGLFLWRFLKYLLQKVTFMFYTFNSSWNFSFW